MKRAKGYDDRIQGIGHRVRACGPQLWPHAPFPKARDVAKLRVALAESTALHMFVGLVAQASPALT